MQVAATLAYYCSVYVLHCTVESGVSQLNSKLIECTQNYDLFRTLTCPTLAHALVNCLLVGESATKKCLLPAQKKRHRKGGRSC